jgi:hypothetical protein
MTLVEQVIHDTGGRIVYSCTLDENGRTVGQPLYRRRRTAEQVHGNSVCECGEGRHRVRSCPTRVRAVIEGRR